MKPLFLTALLLCCVDALAQPSYQQLLDRLKKHPQPDTVRVKLLVDACVSATFRADTVVLNMATEANQLARKLRYDLGQMRSLNCMGNYYFSRALNDKAIGYYLQALRLAEKKHDYRNIVIGKSNVANVFSHTAHDDKAIALLLDCDKILTAQGDTMSQNRAAILTNLANSYANLKQHRKTIAVYETVLKICRTLQIGFGVALTLDNLGKSYLALNQYQKALAYFENAKVEIEKNQVDFVRGKNLKNIGQTYSRLGNTAKSLVYFNQAKAVASQNQDNEGLLDTYFELQKTYAKAPDYQQAYGYLNRYMSLKDSLFGIQKDKTIQELNTRYETEKKDNELTRFAQQKKISDLESDRKNSLIYGILGIILTGAVVAYFAFVRYRTARQNELLNTQLREAERRIDSEKRATESELKALKSQMNPHFMFNALNSIQEQFMYGDKAVANEQMSNFTSLTRQILTLSGKKRITVATEVTMLTNYLELEKMRFAEGFSYSITLSDAIDDDYHQIPPMLIQPFVENSIKHGLMHRQGHKTLSVYFGLDTAEENIICVVEDNGIGREKSAAINQNSRPQHESFSTSATEERLRLTGNGLAGQEFIQYEDLRNSDHTAAGTRVTITVALG